MRSLTASLVLLLGLCLAVGTAQERAEPGPQPPKGLYALAPEFLPGLAWLNSNRPLRLQDLRGKVVLLDFWTYGCINCLHILPDLHRLEAAYGRELVVIGVHSAKYDQEAGLEHIRQAVQRYGIAHPVVNDRDMQIWRAYRVPGWPTQIVIDPEGHLLQGFVGENHYERLDRLIKGTVAIHRQKGTLREDLLRFGERSPTWIPTPLRYPGKVLADAASARLFIADTHHHRIVVTDFEGTLLDVIGRGEPGEADGAFATAAFRQPQGMVLGGTTLYVADTGNHLLRRVDLRRRTVDTVAGTGSKARVFNVPGNGREVALSSPWDLYLQEPYLYIAMAGMHQIWRLDLHTAYLDHFSGTSQEGLSDDLHTNATLGQPSGVSGDGRQLYVADSEVNAVRAASLDPNGTLTTLAGGGLFTFGDRDGVGREVRLQHPLGVAYAEGLVYIADTYNHKIKTLDPGNSRVQTLAGTGVAGYHNGPATLAQFYEPGGLSADAGRLYVADTNNHRVRVIDLATQTVSTLSVTGLTPPVSAAPAAAETPVTAVIRLAEQPVPAAARATLRLVLEPPPGWKVNGSAPASLAVTVAGEGINVPATHARQTLLPFSPPLHVPLEVMAKDVRALVRLDLSFVICQGTEDGVCLLRQVAWEIPVRGQSQASPAIVTLLYRVPTPVEQAW